MNSRWVTISIVGFTQALAWASSFYLPAVLADAIAPDVGLSPAWIFAALSFSLCVTAALGPVCGRLIDERGGRGLIVASNGLMAIGLVMLAVAHGPLSLFLAWTLLGIAMAAGLYEAAFAAITRLYAEQSRLPIIVVTLIAGFASTVGWPLSAHLNQLWGWRAVCLTWAALNLLIALPLNAWALRGAPPPLSAPIASGLNGVETTRASTAGQPSDSSAIRSDPRMWLLATAFTAIGVVTTGIAATLPALLVATGASVAAAISAGALMGPAQAMMRVIEISVRNRVSPLLSARVATLLHPLSAIVLALGGASAASAFALLNGAHNGVLTVSRGTLPLALFGPHGYGARIGKLAVPARIGQAAAPLIFGAGIAHFGMATLMLSGTLSILTFAVLLHPALKHAEAVR